MNTFKKILCPIDFTEHADEALKFAVLLAEKNQSSIHLFHVIPEINYYDWNMNGVYPLISEEILNNERNEAKNKLIELVKRFTSENPKIEISYEMIDTYLIADTIVNIAKKTNIDLIIIGSHGRKGLDRILMGSVAEEVLRHAHCNVMVYKKRAV